MRYYFDLREGADLTADEEGMELSSLAAVQEEAACSLADMARASVKKHGHNAHEMSIEVRDEGGPVMQATFAFGIQQHRKH
jgi:hypothetical protein